jgi:cation transport regulator
MVGSKWWGNRSNHCLMDSSAFSAGNARPKDLIMPYAANADLPAPVRSLLPDHARDIFRAAFNHAFESHRNDPRHKEIAWSAVKRLYKKAGSSWVQREGPDN